MKDVNSVRSPFYVLGKMEILKQRGGEYKFTWGVHM